MSDNLNQPKPANWLRKVSKYVAQLIRKRYGFLMLVLLVGWIPLSRWFLPESITGNVFLLDTYMQLVMVVTLNCMAMIFCVAILRVMNRRFSYVGLFIQHREWIGDGSNPWDIKTWVITLVGAAITPAMIAVLYATEFSGYIYLDEVEPSTITKLQHGFYSAACFVIGAVAALLILFALGRTKCWLFGSHGHSTNYLPFEGVEKKGLFPLEEQIRKYLPRNADTIDVQFAMYTVLLGIAHIGFAYVFFPRFSLLIASAPAVAIVLFWVSGLLLSGMAFWLDQARIPVFVAVLLVALLLQWVWPNPAVFKTVQGSSDSRLFANQTAEIVKAESRELAKASGNRVQAVLRETRKLDDQAWQAIRTRMEHVKPTGSVGRTLVVVTCPGGGIHAAAWSTYVLESLSQRYENFGDSICILSGVSGGSVGTLCFISTAYDDVLGGSKQPASAFELATASSLEPIAFGMMTDDLYGTVIPILSIKDRGQRLEESILERMPLAQQSQTLSAWGGHALRGDLPVVVFNSTDAVSGRRILFDSIPSPRRESGIGLTSRPLNYRELLAHESESGSNPCIDILPATAARTSATFPYVSPFVRPDMPSPRGRSIAIGDGGYVDNEGIVTAVDWIEFMLKQWLVPENKKTFDRILLLRISPSPTGDDLQIASNRGLKDRLRWLTGPLETMVSVRSASQSERGNLESDLAELYLQDARSDQPTRPNPDSIDDQKSNSPVQSIFSQARDTAASAKYRQRMGLELPPKLPTDAPQDQLDVNKPPSGLPKNQEGNVGAIHGPALRSIFDRPVIVKDIQFELGVADPPVIPLNWKLSREQKQLYATAWKWNLENDAELFSILDGLFIKN